eukprot:1963131-Pleurochrysis_carterae.AAC.1
MPGRRIGASSRAVTEIDRRVSLPSGVAPVQKVRELDYLLEPGAISRHVKTRDSPNAHSAAATLRGEIAGDAHTVEGGDRLSGDRAARSARAHA